MRAKAAFLAAVGLAAPLLLGVPGGLGRAYAQERASPPPMRIEGWVYRETSPEPGAFVVASLDEGFSPYGGKYLEHDPTLERRMYTFRTDFVVPDELAEAPLAIFLGPGDYPRDVYLNGILLDRTGNHHGRYNATIYYSSRIALPPQLLSPAGEPNRLAIEAFPATETSPLGDLFLGDHASISRMVFARNFFNVHLVQAADLVSLVIALFFFFLFFRSASRDKLYLWYALVCVSFAIGYSNMSLYHDAANDVL
ncbi:MAG: hypothetical protein Q8M76_15185, partial [Spirochaetaceae bacterium]|nr:hypothetical protein [Spirochaetaceae bacterium]